MSEAIDRSLASMVASGHVQGKVTVKTYVALAGRATKDRRSDGRKAKATKD